MAAVSIIPELPLELIAEVEFFESLESDQLTEEDTGNLVSSAKVENSKSPLDTSWVSEGFLTVSAALEEEDELPESEHAAENASVKHKSTERTKTEKVLKLNLVVVFIFHLFRKLCVTVPL